MTQERNIRIEDYNYGLPEERIAFYPVAQRDQSQLLVYNKGEITDSHFCHLHEFLSADDLLIFNDSKVIHLTYKEFIKKVWNFDCTFVLIINQQKSKDFANI